MRFSISTQVAQDYLTVKKGFDETLFKRLSPPFPPVKLLRFDGSEKGDFVSIELNFLIFRQVWTSQITADHTDHREFYFIDEGIQLPFFLGKWQHKHRIIKSGEQSIIRDEIQYKARFSWLSPLLFPALYLQFLYRKPIYKRIFAIK